MGFYEGIGTKPNSRGWGREKKPPCNLKLSPSERIKNLLRIATAGFNMLRGVIIGILDIKK